MTPPPGDSRERDHLLELALAAERWIDRQRRPAASGRVWSVAADEPGAIDVSLYRGAAGVVLFYLELAAATGERAHLDAALAGADAVATLMDGEDAGVGLYRGASGLAFVLGRAYRAGGVDRHRAAARAAIDTVLARAERRGAGIGWIEPIPFADAFGLAGSTETFDLSRGSAGTALALLDAAEQDLHPAALDAARDVGTRLLEVATPADGGLAWPMMLEPVDWTAPNFAHGTAGIAYCLARLHAATGERRFLDAAVAGARHLCSIATVDGTCRSIHHSGGRGRSLFYLGWCHGPAGTGRLFYELARQTGDEEWTAWLVGGGEALLSSGAPERRSRGYWSNVGQCCGDAAVGEHALSLWRVTDDPRFLELARRVAAWLGQQSAADGPGRCWPQAEHRVRPELVQAQTGYMQGAAGVASFLLRLWALGCGRTTKLPLPDCPFPA